MVHHDEAQELVDQGEVNEKGLIYVAAGGLLLCTWAQSGDKIIFYDDFLGERFLITLFLSLSQIMLARWAEVVRVAQSSIVPAL